MKAISRSEMEGYVALRHPFRLDIRREWSVVRACVMLRLRPSSQSRQRMSPLKSDAFQACRLRTFALCRIAHNMRRASVKVAEAAKNSN